MSVLPDRLRRFALRGVQIFSGAVVSLAMQMPGALAAPDVVASIKPVNSLVAAVMAGVGTPHLLVQGGGSPHTYALRPSDANALTKANLVFWIGPDLERFLVDPLKTLARNANIITLVDAPGVLHLPLRKGGTFEADADEVSTPSTFDMHVWLDPQNAAAMTKSIATALAAADPANASIYAANAAKTVAALAGLEAELKAALAPLSGRPFVVFHDAYHYFENRFGLTAAGSITVSPETAPGAKRLALIKAKVAELGATCVFAEPEFEPRLISVVIEGTKARSGILDPLGAALPDGPDLYFTLLRNMANGFKSCLTS